MLAWVSDYALKLWLCGQALAIALNYFKHFLANGGQQSSHLASNSAHKHMNAGFYDLLRFTKGCKT
jgi:hypothetical protein